MRLAAAAFIRDPQPLQKVSPIESSIDEHLIEEKNLTFSIQSTLIHHNSLITIFTDGNALLLNLLSPFNLYVREGNALKSQNPAEPSSASQREPHTQMFAQPNGDIIEIKHNQVCIKSAWEYFITL